MKLQKDRALLENCLKKTKDNPNKLKIIKKLIINIKWGNRRKRIWRESMWITTKKTKNLKLKGRWLKINLTIIK